jgi:hypothetical protein
MSDVTVEDDGTMKYAFVPPAAPAIHGSSLTAEDVRKAMATLSSPAMSSGFKIALPFALEAKMHEARSKLVEDHVKKVLKTFGFEQLVESPEDLTVKYHYTPKGIKARGNILVELVSDNVGNDKVKPEYTISYRDVTKRAYTQIYKGRLDSEDYTMQVLFNLNLDELSTS